MLIPDSDPRLSLRRILALVVVYALFGLALFA